MCAIQCQVGDGRLNSRPVYVIGEQQFAAGEQVIILSAYEGARAARILAPHFYQPQYALVHFEGDDIGDYTVVSVDRIKKLFF